MIAESRRSGAVSIFVPVICSRLKSLIHAICTACIKIGAVIFQLLATRRWVNNADPNGFLIGKAVGNQHAPVAFPTTVLTIVCCASVKETGFRAISVASTLVGQ